MLGVRLICVGKLKERYFQEAVAEYQKRLAAFCKFEIVELPEERLPEQPTAQAVEQALFREAGDILRHIPAGAAATALCVEGEALSSEELAETLRRWTNAGKSRLCFVIGGSYGLHPAVKEAAQLRLSMGRMTFPHHLARVMVAEQIYRAFTILAGKRYHK